MFAASLLAIDARIDSVRCILASGHEDLTKIELFSTFHNLKAASCKAQSCVIIILYHCEPSLIISGVVVTHYDHTVNQCIASY